MGYAPYDGVLVSRGIVGDHRVSGKYTEAQAMRFRRVGAPEFLRLNKPEFAHLSIFGDCGASRLKAVGDTIRNEIEHLDRLLGRQPRERNSNDARRFRDPSRAVRSPLVRAAHDVLAQREARGERKGPRLLCQRLCTS
jgi:hypothetical protein